MRQVVDGVKAIKFYACEENYLAKVASARLTEVTAIKRYKQLQTFGVILGRAGPVFATAAVFIARTAEGRSLSSAEAFATLAVFQVKPAFKAELHLLHDDSFFCLVLRRFAWA